MPPVIGKNGIQTPAETVGFQPEIHAIYLKKTIDAFGVNLQMDKYGESIDVPSGLYGQDLVGTAYNETNDSKLVGRTSTKDVTNIRMTGKDDIARYIQFGDAGLMGRSAAVDGTGLSAFNPYHLGVDLTGAGALDTFNASLDGSGDLPLITRNWELYEIPINHDDIWQNQLNFKKNDHLPDYEIDGFIKRFGDINKIDNWVKLMLPTQKNRDMFEAQGVTAAIMMDQFYRQNLLNTCSDGGAVTVYTNLTEANGGAAEGWKEFLQRVEDIVEQLAFFKAKPVLEMKTGTTVPSSVPLEKRFRILYYEGMERYIKKIPGFVHTNEYGFKPMDPDEFGSIDNIAFVKCDSIAANVSNHLIHDGTAPAAGNLLASDEFGKGMRMTKYNFIIISGKAYGILKMRGLKNFNVHIVDGNKSEAGNPLALASTYGWISYGGFIMMRPTHTWKIEATFDYEATSIPV